MSTEKLICSSLKTGLTYSVIIFDLGIGHAMNLGMYDFFPIRAGKGQAVRYLQTKWGFKVEFYIP